jgi:hypothetical protein
MATASADHHVTDVDADAEINATIRRETSVRLGQSSLGLYRALHSFNCASELRKDTIARRVRYAAPMLPNEPVEDRAPFGQSLERADLISAHQAAVALDIRCEDCDEASADWI